jgi:hypothetical protein
MKKILVTCLLLLGVFSFGLAQKVENATIRERIELYKSNPRGPYKDIRWFCKDGSFVMPKEKCAEPGGIQRARYKDEVVALGKSNHIFFGQILSKTPNEDFWDADHYNSRLKQYQLEKYLRSIDDGWILQKGQFYRGAYQIEDEEAWGVDFFQWLLQKDQPLQEQFYLVRQAAKDIPHQGDTNKSMSVRAVSKTISDAYPAFMNLRVKIHGQPEAADIEKVMAFRDQHQSKLSAGLLRDFDTLIADMKEVYQAVNLQDLHTLLKQVPKESPIYESLADYIKGFNYENTDPARLMATAEKLAEIRDQIQAVKSRKGRLALLDLSNALEAIFFVEIGQWKPETVKEVGDKICYIGLATVGTGLVEQWEWDELEGAFAIPANREVTLGDLHYVLNRARSLVEWGTGMVNGVYKDVVNVYSGFEPLAYGFFDDRIRGSVLLSLGNTVGQLGDFIAQSSNLTNSVMGLSNQSTFRGLNPGYAMGELVVVDDQQEIEVDKDKIYVFYNPPSDLKPVAGILTVTEGNMVSHVQLLARNLGIPNAVLSAQNLNELRRYSGKKVFYAVSNRGTMIMKDAAKMTEVEKELFSQKKRSEDRITVPIEKMDLAQTSVLNMREVNAASSGKVCGPKAANLGQLKLMFPENVVEGIVLPFGVFRAHLDQQMPGQNKTYWNFLNTTFTAADDMRKAGSSEEEIEKFTLSQLEVLREAIKKIQFLPSFEADLEGQFKKAFGKELGKVPVFIRSDTNMEDLKDFTGAGLNLTIFNAVNREKIIQGIRDVWASPYTERSFKWRQRYLLNPENVFPSILIIPSVDVDYSGVLITKGIPTTDGRDLTVAFSRGAGGAVDGQAAESYLLDHNRQNYLLSPAREPQYRKLPQTGGSEMKFATFEKPVLNDQNLMDLRWLAYNVHQEIPKTTGVENQGAYDVELGFKENKVWLFQIRPFVENKSALSSGYLESISPVIDYNKKINTNTKL